MIDRRVGLLVGGVVLGAVLAVVWWLVSMGAAPEREPAAATTDAPVVPSSGATEPKAPAVGSQAQPQGLTPAVALAPQDPSRPMLRGIVQLPDGRPAAGAEVKLYRQVSAWPEWRRVILDSATTGAAGTFQFAVERAPDLLVGFEHPDYAGGLREAPPSLAQLVLRLQPGFAVEGIVLSDGRRPTPNVRVALESMLADDRSVRTTETSNAGRFRFANVAVGAMRVVARHPSWQPAVQNNVVVGENRTLQLVFDRPTVNVEGRVVAAGSQEPIVGAIVLALPPGQFLGRNDPATAISGSDGRFFLRGLPLGNQRLEVRHDRFATVARTIVVTTQAGVPQVFDLPVRTHVHGRLRPIAVTIGRGATLLLRSAADEITSTVVQQDGSFDFSAAVTPGRATLTLDGGGVAFVGGAGSVQVQVEEGADRMLDLEVGPAAVVTGRVVDAEGSPIAGAWITARQLGIFAERLRQAGSALLDRDLRRFGDQLSRSSGGEPEPLLAVSATDGTYRIAGLPPGSVTVHVARDGFGGQSFDVKVPAVGEVLAAPDTRLERGGRIRGIVRRSGHPLPGAQCGLVVDGNAVTAVTDIDGRYELADLPRGQFRVRARYSTFPTVFAADAVAVEPDAVATVDLEFPPGRVVRGVVRGNGNQPIEGAMVLVLGEASNPVVTDNAGAFSLEAPNRAIELQVALGDRGARRVVAVDLAQNEVEVRIDAPPNCTILATVLGLPGRKPLPFVLVRIAAPGDDLPQSRWIEVHGGRLRYPWFPAGQWQVTFWSEGYAPIVRSAAITAGDELDFGELLFESGCELRGVVLGDQDRPIAGAEVFLGEEGDLDVFASETRSGADGRFVVRGVSSRAATLVVRAPGYAPSLLPLRLPRDVLGKEPFAVHLLRGASIEAEVDAEPEGSVVVLRRNGRVIATTEVDASGRAVFGNRGPGEYLVQLFGDDRRQVVAVVTTSGEVVRVRL